ncbi:hypothetical protein UYSO10_2868 [Kosakonia radicincitans]|nr:hypothetical protein UYSO10_2868 [Kosakonia radicincitans]
MYHIFFLYAQRIAGTIGLGKRAEIINHYHGRLPATPTLQQLNKGV